MANHNRASWKQWSDIETLKLKTIAGEKGTTQQSWPKIAEQFPGRTAVSCRLHYQTVIMREASANEAPRPKHRVDRRPSASVIVRQEPIDLPLPASITAWLCGDPRPGRSALDKKLSEGARP